MELSSSEQAMIGAYVCGLDYTGAILVADSNNKRFQIHETDQWSVVNMDPISSHKPRDFVYDADTDTVWVLSKDKTRFYLSKLEILS